MPALQQLARAHDVELTLLGLTGGDALAFDGQLHVPLSELREAWEGALLAGPAVPPTLALPLERGGNEV
jgi:hypothetical protein